ncbi:MAG: helix-turn-helix transcriptional regulator [Balneolaceae bacterium]|nr:helix-turn-helix transcriptional regulator [Balneolaceae bacterium]
MDSKYPTGPIKTLIEQMSNLQKFRDRNKDRFNTLTDRETEILALIGKGMGNPDIGKKLDISRTTVQNHRAQIRDKLNINNQVDYVKYALAYELIEF